MQKFSRSVRFLLVIAFWFCLIFHVYPDASHAQGRIEIPSSPNPVGSGARALGMGGAFIGVADDATAASWNPAGLVQLDLPEISIVGSAISRDEDLTFGTNPEASGNNSVSDTRLNYLSVAYPFALWGMNMVVSLNNQHLYDFTREWNFHITDISGGKTSQDFEYQQEGALSAVGIAWSMRVNPQISLGLTLNIWNDDLSENGWEQRVWSWGTGASGSQSSQIGMRSLDRYSFSGINANLGVMWKVYKDMITIGAVLKTPFQADLDHEHVSITLQPDSAATVTSIWEDRDGSMDMPMSFGIGMGCRFGDALTASLDIYRTEWGDFILSTSEGDVSPITGGDPGKIDPTHQVRSGMEYLFIKPAYVIPVRAGVFYDPAPAEGSPDNIYGVSLGSGIVKAFKEDSGFGVESFAFDIAWQYRFGDNVGSSILQARDFSQDIKEHTVYSSVIIYF